MEPETRRFWAAELRAHRSSLVLAMAPRKDGFSPQLLQSSLLATGVLKTLRDR